MTRRHDGGAGVSPRNRKHGALLSAIVALIVAVSAGLYFGVAADPAGPEQRRSVARGSGGSGNRAAPASAATWVGAWATAPTGAEPGTDKRGTAGRSVRNVVRLSVGGKSARVTFSNHYGQTPLTLTGASLAVASGAGAPAAEPGTMRRLTFSGQTTVRIPAGGQVTSDAVGIPLAEGADVLVTTYSPTPSGPVTYHRHARQTSWLARGDHTEDVTGAAYTEPTPYWRHVVAVDVLSDEAEGTVVAFGDSLTDGITSTVDANLRWPDVVAARLRTSVDAGRDLPRYSVVNAGISGNRLLANGTGRPADNPSGLTRFERDVLARPNVKVVVVDLGVNDILRTPGAIAPDEVLDGLRALVRQAHARGIKVVGATLMPFQGHRGWSSPREAVRQRINAEIRSGRIFDAVVDFDEAVRDPYAPRRLRPDYDSGDHLHPSDRGYARMAEVFDLEDLKGSAPTEL